MKIQSMPIGYKFISGEKKYVRIPEMVIHGHEENFVINCIRVVDTPPLPVPIVMAEFLHPHTKED